MGEKKRLAIDAVYNVPLNSAEEKMIVLQLTSKHQMAQQHMNAYRDVGNFLEDFSEKWMNRKELQSSLHLSDSRLDRSLDSLKKLGYVLTTEKEVTKSGRNRGSKKSSDGRNVEETYSLSNKIFQDYQKSL